MLGFSCTRRRALSLVIKKSRAAAMVPLPEPRCLFAAAVVAPGSIYFAEVDNDDEKGPRLSIGDRGRLRQYIEWLPLAAKGEDY
eukprot:9550875-Lingulodinium_polyedra.AAC.1